MSLRGTGLRPDDLTGELFGVDEDDRFCRQFFRRAGPRCREIVTQNFGRFGVKRHVERRCSGYLASRHVRPRPQPTRAEHRRHAGSELGAGCPVEPPQARADFPGAVHTALTKPGRAGDAISKSRLYGWLMPAYKDPDSSLLREHPTSPRHPRIGRIRRAIGVGELGRLPLRGPGCMLVAYTHPGNRVTMRLNSIPSIPWPLRGS